MRGCLIVVIILVIGVVWFWHSGDEPEDKALAYIKTHEQVRSLLKDADHVGVYTVESRTGLREFISSMMAYQPWWETQLYRVRALFVRLLGMKQDEIPQPVLVAPDKVPMQKGEAISFFQVVAAKEDSFWVVKATDKHLSAHMAVVMEPVKEKLKRFHLVIVVHYHNWAGPVYFNVIRPFERIIARKMAEEGAKGAVTF